MFMLLNFSYILKNLIIYKDTVLNKIFYKVIN